MQQKKNLMLAAVAAATLLFAGCTAPSGDPEIYGTATGGTLTPDTIQQAGSSTVLPLAEMWAEDFGTARGVQISVAGGGSGAGATALCNGEIDIGDMSRTIKDSEVQNCRQNGVEPVEWKVAFDGLTVAVSQDNDFVDDLTVDQLAQIFRGEGHATTWNQVDPDYPNQPIRLCYPGEDSGTYEYFNEEILDEGEPRHGDGVQKSEDDNVLVQCIASDRLAIGYFGFAYLQENQDKVRAVKVNGVAPTFETIADGTYSPLGRPIYMYTNGVPTGLLADYFHYAFHPEGGQRLVEDVGYVQLDETTRLDMLQQMEG